MKILFIAPLPPPIDGQSKASKVLLDKLYSEYHDVSIINLTKSGSKTTVNTLKRAFRILYILYQIWLKRKGNSVIYLSLAESFLGNLRDLFVYLICYKNIDKVYIHMLGGAGMKEILEKKGIQQAINKFFISKIGGVIVEGPVNFNLFSKVIAKSKIHIVPNFAEDYLFVTDEEIEKKFQKTSIIRILYLSNLLPGKGYDELADAYIHLTPEEKKEIEITFVGGFESEKSKSSFLTKISKYNNLKYLGKFIDGEKKRELYCESHIFCLPTYYPYEGQPISILEAYATGCFVITTDHSGIPFIFNDVTNGHIVAKRSVQSIEMAIKNVLRHRDQMKSIAFVNRNIAFEKYRTYVYQNAIVQVFSNSLVV